LSKIEYVIILFRKFKSLIYYIDLYFKQSIKYAIEIKQRLYFRQWSLYLKIKKYSVILGGNVETYGGVHHHIQAIKNFSKNSIVLLPSNFILEALGIHRFTSKYLKEINLNNVKVVHSHVYPWMIKWCNEQKLNNPNIKWVHTYHAHYYPEYSDGEFLDWQKEFNRFFLEEASKADIKISVSKWQQKIYKEKFNINTVYVPNGVNVLQCDNVNKDDFKERNNLQIFILNVSGHDPVKNPKEFVLLAQSMPKYNFVIIGNDLTKDLFKEHYNTVVPKNLSILGKMSQIEVQHAIAASTCLVSTSKKEGLPTLILEGMAQSKPVVVSNEPGSMEAIDHGEYGYFYELGNIQDLKKQILLALKDEVKPKKARQRVLQEYDWRVVIKKLDKLYNDL